MYPAMDPIWVEMLSLILISKMFLLVREMSLYPDDGNRSAVSIYPDSQPNNINAWSEYDAISDVNIPSPYNLYLGGNENIGGNLSVANDVAVAGGVVATTSLHSRNSLLVETTSLQIGNVQMNNFLNVSRDITAGGNITATADFLGNANCRIQGQVVAQQQITTPSFIQAGGKVQTPQLVVPNLYTPTMTSAITTGANGYCVIQSGTPNDGLQVLDGNLNPGPVSALSLNLPGAGGGAIVNLQTINGVPFNSVVVNPLQGQLNANSQNIINANEITAYDVIATSSVSGNTVYGNVGYYPALLNVQTINGQGLSSMVLTTDIGLTVPSPNAVVPYSVYRAGAFFFTTNGGVAGLSVGVNIQPTTECGWYIVGNGNSYNSAVIISIQLSNTNLSGVTTNRGGATVRVPGDYVMFVVAPCQGGRSIGNIIPVSALYTP